MVLHARTAAPLWVGSVWTWAGLSTSCTPWRARLSHGCSTLGSNFWDTALREVEGARRLAAVGVARDHVGVGIGAEPGSVGHGDGAAAGADRLGEDRRRELPPREAEA